MKQIVLILLFSFFIFNGFGKDISKERAVKVASNFLFNESHAIRSVTSYGEEEKSRIYVVNFDPEGWALVSSSENARPVIGYSREGFFDVSKVNWNIKDWLDIQTDQISKVKANSKWKEEWEILDRHKLPVLKSASEVKPLIKAKWNQDAGWNRFCPDFEDGPNGKAYVGCVAVAMAQALYYVKYPARPTGSKTYTLPDKSATVSLNFDNEPDYNWGQMSATTSDDYNARLLFNCAVAVEMDFGSDGSGAYTARVPFALQRYFGFSNSVKSISRYENDNEWIALLKSELDKGNVLIYSGNPTNGGVGHAFNIDGYDNKNYFHFNWGWSGNLNGYLSINNVAPGSDDFTQNQKVVIGISEPYWGPTDITLSNQKIKENMPAGTVVGNISITDNSEDDQFTINVFGAKRFEQEGYAPAKFEEKNMQLISMEPLTKGVYPEVATIRVTDNEGNTFEKRFDITVTPTTSIDEVKNKLSVYPNPVNDIIHLSGINELKSYRIINSTGVTVSSSSNFYENDIYVGNLQNGLYFLEFTDDANKKQIQKFIIQK